MYWIGGGILFMLVVISLQVYEIDKKMKPPCIPHKPEEAESIEIVLDNVEANQKK